MADFRSIKIRASSSQKANPFGWLVVETKPIEAIKFPITPDA
jgi:hypothetical protein